MKHFLLFTALCGIAFGNLRAQNVGIGTASPNSSALLDLTSTAKGFLAPRMSTAQRTSIVDPVKGLLVYDTDLNSLYHYNGSGWAAVGGGGGGFTLPFSQTINTIIPAFQVIEQGSGAALEGSSSNELGIGVTAKTSGDYGFGLYAVSSKPGARSIFVIADSGEVFHGENNWVGTTGTLMSLLNRGVGKTVTVQLQNNTSNSANMQIAGNALGEQLLIFQTNAANTKAAVSVSNSGTGVGVASVANNGTGMTATSTSGIGIIGTSTSSIGVSGVSSTNYGVKGVTTSATGFAGVHGSNLGTAGSGVIGVSDAVNTQGVYGTSVNGIGVRAASNVYRAVQATSTSGTALFGSSTSGYSLDISGNVKIAGGNTNPAAGAVLTSVDASGNAVWKNNKIGFIATNSGNANQDRADEATVILTFDQHNYDPGNDFLTNAAPSDKNTFIVPVAGLYHIDGYMEANIFSATTNLQDAVLYLYVNGSSVLWAAGAGPNNSSVDTEIPVLMSADVHLNAGDKVTLRAWSNNLISLAVDYENARFSGFLVFPD